MNRLDVYYCTNCPEETAVKAGKEPQYCSFCTCEITYSHTTELEDEMEGSF